MSSSCPKRSTGAAPADSSAKKAKATTTQSPHDKFFDLLRAAGKRAEAIGQMIIRGLPDDEEEEEEEDTSKLTTAEMETLRFVFITESRADALTDMERLVLGDQYGDSIMCFNTSFSYTILDSYETIEKTLYETKSLSKKFDILFAYTHTINTHDVWMQDHEVGWGGETFIADLAKRWKAMLKESDADLGIDSEFTRPGIVCFLTQFKEQLEGVDTSEDPPITFDFQ